MSSQPPDFAIQAALRAAAQSPCAKSKRGVVIYHRSGTANDAIVGEGFNGTPDRSCAGDEQCRATCNKRCVHAEDRAIRQAEACKPGNLRSWCWDRLEAVHVKRGPDGQLVAGGGPSCWQCSRVVADVGLGGFWLYQDTDAAGFETDGTWRRYTAEEFHSETLRTCGIEVRR